MTLFQFIGNGGDGGGDFHVFSAVNTALPGPVDTFLSPGGGNIPRTSGEDELALPVPAGIVYTRITIWWRVAAGQQALIDVSVLINGAPIIAGIVDGATGPGVVLTSAIVAHPPTALDDLVQVVMNNPTSLDTPTDIFVRLDYTQ